MWLNSFHRKMFPLKKNISIRKKLFLIVLSFFACFVVILNTNFAPDLYFMYNLENVSCHYSVLGDALPLVEDGFEPAAKSIFFHETSCHGRLNSRQACAVESAARMHPDWEVHLLFSGPVGAEQLGESGLGAVNKFDNVHVSRLRIVEYARGTPLEDMVAGGAMNRSRWRVSHTSDVLRYLSLYKWGGVYLDLDVLVVKSFDSLADNWAARESDTAVAAGALAFSQDPVGRAVAEATVRDFKTNYRGDDWGNNGPGVITRVLETLCNTKHLTNMSADTCKGFEVYGPELFYPVNYYAAIEYFSPGELNVGDPYTYHVWNKLTQDFPVQKEFTYAKLAKKHCPSVYELYGDKFGL